MTGENPARERFITRYDHAESSAKRVRAYAAVAVEAAARHGRILCVGTEAKRLLSDYPDCAIGLDDLQNQLARQASQKGVTVEFN
jgi:hypothetical protein